MTVKVRKYIDMSDRWIDRQTKRWRETDIDEQTDRQTKKYEAIIQRTEL